MTIYYFIHILVYFIILILFLGILILILVAAPCILSNYLIVYQLMHIHKTFSH